MGKIVIYYRVSTKKQEQSGLGLEAQEAAVSGYVKRTHSEVLRRYREVESGTKAARPQLAKALLHAKRSRATLVVAKLDRLARNVAFLQQLQDAKVRFVALDAEYATKLTLTIMMAMAEHEAEAISQRTKAALAARKARGLPMGATNPGCRNLTPRQARIGRALGAESNHRQAIEAYADIVPDMQEWREDHTLQAIADRLNDQGQTTRTGRDWTPATVARVLRRAERASD